MEGWNIDTYSQYNNLTCMFWINPNLLKLSIQYFC